MTPIKNIVLRGLDIVVIDHADNEVVCCTAASEQQGEWLLYSLKKLHIPHVAD